MASHSSSAAKAPAGRHAAGSARPSLRETLRIVPSRRTKKPGRRGRTVELIALALVVGALLAVVVGQAIVTNDANQMAALQTQLAIEQSTHRTSELQVATLETPQRIVGDALKDGLVHPAQVNELPYVSLNTPVATPNVTPAPAPTTTTTVPATTTTTTPSTSTTTTPSTSTTTPSTAASATGSSTP